jgi:hypothetical protein
MSEREACEPDHVLADAGLPDFDAEFQEFTVNARRTHNGFSRLMVRMSWRTGDRLAVRDFAQTAFG